MLIVISEPQPLIYFDSYLGPMDTTIELVMDNYTNKLLSCVVLIDKVYPPFGYKISCCFLKLCKVYFDW